MITINATSKGVIVPIAGIRFRSKISLDQIVELMRSFMAFDEGVDWGLSDSKLWIKHPSLYEVVIVYLSLRRLGLGHDEAIKTLKSMRSWEISYFAHIIEYRLALCKASNSRQCGSILMKIGRAIRYVYGGES